MFRSLSYEQQRKRKKLIVGSNCAISAILLILALFAAAIGNAEGAGTAILSWMVHFIVICAYGAYKAIVD